MREITAADRDLRQWIYARIVSTGLIPSIDTLSSERGASRSSVAESLRRLADVHALALAPGTGEIWMAHPFSAVPTPYAVVTPLRTYRANCAWDAVAIPPLLGVDATIDARCPDCAEPIQLEFVAGEPSRLDGVVHFAVQPRDFWRDIGYT
jgi:hypothetical protein